MCNLKVKIILLKKIIDVMELRKPRFIPLEDIARISPELSDKIARCAINVPTQDVLWWSLTLSLLYPVRKREKFASRFKKLLAFCYHPDPIPNAAQKETDTLFDFLKGYNPFLDRQSCFSNTTFENLLRIYKERHPRNEQRDFSVGLQEICQLIQCNIIFCDLSRRE